MEVAPHKKRRGSLHFGFVYVNSFGSHQCGNVLKLGSRRSLGRRGRGQEEPREGKARAQAQGGSGQPGGQASAAQASTSATQASTSAAQASTSAEASASIRPRASRVRSRSKLTARAGVSQKNAAKTYDFPISSLEASEKRKKKKASVWKDVRKVISRMMEENEKYRLRLNYPKPANNNSN